MCEDKNCRECCYFKENINRRLMGELGIDEKDTKNVIWLRYCTHPEKKNREILNLNDAKSCEYYDEDSWIK